MNVQELANHFERSFTIPEERCSDEWDAGWNSAVGVIIRIMREQEVN